MNEAQAMELLRKAVTAAGGQRAFSRQHSFSAAYVNDVLLGRRGLSDNMCAALGLKRTVTYTTEYKRERK